MLIRLSLQNARKTFGDYAIYVLTVSLMIALNFMLNRLIFSPELSSVTESSSGMQMMFGAASFVMLTVVFALIKYMTRFILNRRSKEFGLYQLMGIEDKQIKRIYWIEQCYLGCISMIIGLLVGLLAGEVFRSIVFNYIGIVDYKFAMEGLGAALLLTAGETVFAYLLVKLTGRKLFRSRNILSWLQAERKNEKVKENSKTRYLLAFFWAVTGIGSMVYFACNLNSVTTGMALCCSAVLLVSTFGFSTCLVRIISGLLLRNDKQFTLKVLPVRFVSKRIATRSRQIGILAMVFMLSVGLMSVGMLFANYTRVYSREYNGFDFYYTPDVTDGVTDEFIDGMEDLLQEFGINDSYVIEGYLVEDSELDDFFPNRISASSTVSLSTYNRVREMLGYEPAALEKDEFILQTHMQLMDADEIFYESEYSMLGRTLKMKSLEITAMNTACVANGDAYYAVVPDELLSDRTADYYAYAYQLENKDYQSLSVKMNAYVLSDGENIGNALMEIYNSDGEYEMSSNFVVTKALINLSAFGFAATAIALLFIGIVFALVLSTILAVLLTSEISENRQRFQTLHRLGAGKKEREGVLKKQITSLFSVPVIVGLPLVATVCLIISKLFKSVMTGMYMAANISLTIVIFLIIYLLYMVVTYKSMSKSVMSNK